MKIDTADKSLVLIGHGSTVDRRAAEPVYRTADRLRDAFASVRVAFWKEQPSIDDAIESSASDEVIVVPYFMADGYYVADAIPTALGLTEWPEVRVETRGSKQVAYTHAVGSHPDAVEVLEATIRESLAGRDPEDVCVALVGHGTRRRSSSRFSVLHACDALRATGRYAEVRPAFIDDEPGIPELFDAWSTEILVVPYMVADGPHVRSDLVSALRLPGFEQFGVARAVGDHSVTLAAPIGTRREMTRFVEARVAEVLDVFVDREARERQLNRALDELLDAMATTPITLGAVQVTGHSESWSVRARNDADVPADALERRPSRGAWRWWRRNDRGAYRPWLAGTDAPSGWLVEGSGAAALWDLLELLSPGGLVAWYRHRSGSLRSFSFTGVAARQSGPMRAARGFEVGDLEDLIGSICHSCERRVVWRATRGIDAPRGGAAEGPPCELPCGRLLSEACRRVRAAGLEPDVGHR